MPDPYKAVHTIGSFMVTAVVIDQSEFDALCDELHGLFAEMTEETVETLKRAKHIPMMGRGTKTERFFNRYDVETDKMSIIVRGAGSEILTKYLVERN